MSQVVHALEYLAKPSLSGAKAICVAYGEEAFLRGLVVQSIRSAVLGDGDDTPFAEFTGKEVQWRDVADELATVSLFSSGPRLAVVHDADPFVSRHRTQLEDYAESKSPKGMLLLLVKSWPSNTRLFKRVDAQGLAIQCQPPMRKGGRTQYVDTARVKKWIGAWGKRQYAIELDSLAVDLLLEIHGPEFGMLDQSLAKLALYVNPNELVSAELVQQVVATWRTQTAWEIVDAAADGKAVEAMQHLDTILRGGDRPQAVFGQIAWSLRRYADACRIVQRQEREGRRPDLSSALSKAGFFKGRPGALDEAKSRLRQIGRQRAGSLHRWLLEADLALKGSHSRPERGRLVIEQLIFKLSAEASGRQANKPR